MTGSVACVSVIRMSVIIVSSHDEGPDEEGSGVIAFDVPGAEDGTFAIGFTRVVDAMPTEILFDHGDASGAGVAVAVKDKRADDVLSFAGDGVSLKAEDEIVHRLAAEFRLFPEPLPRTRRIHAAFSKG